MKINRENMLLYAVTDRLWCGKYTLYEQLEQALRGGVTLVQLREKKLDEDSFLKEALRIRELCHSYNVPLIINDNVEVTLKSNADGIHIGQDDLSASEVRKLLGKDKIIGVSAHNVTEAIKAEADGADYLGVGAAFVTGTKKDAKAIAHSEILAIRRAVNIPICTIGGISKDNMSSLKGCGADGAALVSAIFSAEDIEQECRELLALSKSTFGGNSL